MNALALEKTEMNEVVDHTIPEYDSILQNCGQAIQIFNRVMAEASPPPTEEPKKERAKPAPKRKKEAEVSEPVYDNDVKEAIAAGLLSKYKVPDLVAILKAANQPVKSKKKADLLAAIDTIYASL